MKMSKILSAGLVALSVGTFTGAAYAAPITVAVINDNSGAGNAAGVAAQLNASSEFSFAATALNQSNINSLADLSGYDAVVLGGSGYSGSFSAASLAAIDAFLTGGGGVVTTGWYSYTVQGATGQAAIDANAITPIVPNYNFQYSGTVSIDNGTNPITQGVNDFSVPGCCTEYATSVDPGAVVLGTLVGNSSAITIAEQDLIGRSVYLGPVYMGASGYDLSALASGDANQLLAQAVAWSANGSPSSVPAPAAFALLGLGLIGIGGMRRKAKAA